MAARREAACNAAHTAPMGLRQHGQVEATRCQLRIQSTQNAWPQGSVVGTVAPAGSRHIAQLDIGGAVG